MQNILSQKEIDERLEQICGWEFKKDKLSKNFSFKDFRDAMSFLLRLSYEAEAINHHPEIFNFYNRVVISLNTHEVGSKVTGKDFELAHSIDALLLSEGD